MHRISLDLETASPVDLAKCGVYKYAEQAEILLLGYSVDGGPVRTVDIKNKEPIPEALIKGIKDPAVEKWAHNASFERVLLSHHFGMPVGSYLDPAGWRCTMVWANAMCLPPSLAMCAMALNLKDGKLAQGKELIEYFCTGKKDRHDLMESAMWEEFKRYNIRDVEVEMSIAKALRGFELSAEFWEDYEVDQRINDRGILVDLTMAQKAIELGEAETARLLKRMKEITGLENPGSVQQLRKWCAGRGFSLGEFDKKAVNIALKQENLPDDVRELLQLRLLAGKSSLKKYQAMVNFACSDNRIRGAFQFHGSRTGRWAGRGVQLQNLPQNHLKDIEVVRAQIRKGDTSGIDDLTDTLSQLIRTAFIPAPGKTYLVADFSAIEARVLAWFAGEQWVLDAFANGKDIYCETASQMFHVPVVKHGVNSELRQKGKQTVLGCGYGGSVGALKAMGALELGIQEEELLPLVKAWRDANPRIVKFWWAVDAAVRDAIEGKTTDMRRLRFERQSRWMFITLPSGRKLSYFEPRIEADKITFRSMTAGHQWERVEAYGPRFVENIVQATARDLLCAAMRKLGDLIVMHVHDEVIVEIKRDDWMEVADICAFMKMAPAWAEGMPLNADGYQTDFYKKD